MTTVIFKEKQKFSQVWIWILIIGLTSVLAYSKYKTYYLKEVFGKLEPSDSFFYTTDIIIVLIFAILVTANLKTEVRIDGLYYKFFPFHLKMHHIKWTDIKFLQIRKYKPVSEYLGWGIKFGPKGKAFNVSGDIGFQVVMKNGKRILFGTQQSEKLQEAFKKINIAHINNIKVN